MFMGQRTENGYYCRNGAMVYIANEMTPFSSNDATVFSNCDEVRLTAFEDGKTYTYKKNQDRKDMPSHPS